MKVIYAIKRFFRWLWDLRYIGRFFKRLKMMGLFKDYYSFDIMDSIFKINMEMFKDFYENGGLEMVDWEYTEEHRNAKKKMDRIYFWYTKLHPKYIKRHEKLLHYVYRDRGVENINDPINVFKKPYQDILWRSERIMEKQKFFYLHMLIDIKDYLWT
jgi:hypothetical protein